MNSHRIFKNIFFFLTIILISSALSCSDYNEGQPDSSGGSASFSIRWMERPSAQTPINTRAAEIDCAGLGISTIDVNVYSEADLFLVGQPFNCTDGTGTVHSIPPGSNRKFIILGTDVDDNILYRGEATGVTINEDENTNIGTIYPDLFAPQNIIATPYDSQVFLTWDNVVGASIYYVYWSTTSGVTKNQYSEINDGFATTSYLHTGRSNGTTYYYVVTAVDSTGNESVISSEVNAIPEAADSVPVVPTNIVATTGDEQVTVTWDAVFDAVSYNCYIGNSSDVSKTDYSFVDSSTTTTYTWSGLTNGTTYYFIVTAVNGAGEGNESSVASATPEAPATIPAVPANVAATTADQQVTITWDAVTGAGSYRCYINTSSDVSKTNYSGMEITIPATYTWSGLTNGTTYYFVVTAVNSVGESTESIALSAIPEAPATAPAAPINFIATALNEQVTLRWDAVTDAESYYCYIGNSSGISKTVYAAVDGTSLATYTWEGLTNDSTYYFIVTAANSVGESVESNEISATPGIVIPLNIPATSQTTCTNNEVTIACPDPGNPFYGQDAQYATNPRSFIKLDSVGTQLPDTALNWDMVYDNITNLTWEIKKFDGSINDMNDTYTWQDAQDIFITQLNNNSFGGYNDWRLPSILELVYLTEKNLFDPSVNTTYFPNTKIDQYWTGTTKSDNINQAWRVGFNGGEFDSVDSDKSFRYYVRAVRGNQAQPKLIDNLDGTVSDISTGLMWQKYHPGTSYLGPLTNWEEALSYCENLDFAGYSDWRLPNYYELLSIVDFESYEPSINENFFPNTASIGYWSSTTYGGSVGHAFTIYFQSITSTLGMKNEEDSKNYIRAVRDLP